MFRRSILTFNEKKIQEENQQKQALITPLNNVAIFCQEAGKTKVIIFWLE